MLSLYISKVSEEVASYSQKCLRRQPLPFDAAFPRNPSEYPHIPYISRNIDLLTYHYYVLPCGEWSWIYFASDSIMVIKLFLVGP